MTNSEVFLAYAQACTDMNLELALSFFTPQSVYHNIPMEPLHGIDGARLVLVEFFKVTSAVRFDVHAIAESLDGEVLTRRTDHFCVEGVWRAVEVMGSVLVKDGKILIWREYYDSRQMEAAFAKAPGTDAQ
jgi:limonene-1,2-epoxide hydrolase